MSHENIQALLYALYTLKPESSRVRHPHIQDQEIWKTLAHLFGTISCGIDYLLAWAKLGP